LTINVISQKKY